MNVDEYVCPLCGKPVDPLDATNWQRQEGWHRTVCIRASGKHGGSDIALRAILDEYAHNICVRERQQGLAGQQSFLDQDDQG